MEEKLKAVASERPPEDCLTIAPNITTLEPAQHKESQIQSFSPANPLESDDWANILPECAHVDFFRSRNWSKSILGPLKTWGRSLRLHTFTVLAESRPACLYWGPDRVAIYNQYFVPLAGKAHPELMGRTFRQGFPGISETINPVFEEAERTGMASAVTEIPLFVERYGYLEEAYFTGNFVPMRGDTGKVEGFLNTVYEVTKQKINDRRTATLSQMKAPTGTETTSLENVIMPALERNDKDITMALLYRVDEEKASGSCFLRLCGHTGVPAGHKLLVEEAEITSQEGIIPLLHRAQTQIITVPVDSKFEGIQWRGFGEPSKTASVLPISSSGRLLGFLVIGLNPRRTFDEHYDNFLYDLSHHITAVISSIITAEESRKRAARLQRELADSERQIRYMAQHASVGMQYLSIDGTTIWANEQYYKLTGHPRPDQPQYKFSFLDVYIDEDRTRALDSWTRLLEGEQDVSVELRLKKSFSPPAGDPEPACILSLSFPYVENGEVKSIMTCTTDVSQLKWAETAEARNADDARAAKRKQEEFIDVVSHEMRNPLSAIFQCADMIASSQDDYQLTNLTTDHAVEIIANNVDAAKTILMCAAHQKRIVDDVLTLSKLEYMMLSISPSAIRPSDIVQSALRMFDSDLLAHDITIRTVAEPSLSKHNIDWVLLDPSRVTQILINLLTNAIKFTKTERRREITVRYGGSLSDPRTMFSKDVHWAPAQDSDTDLGQNPEWGNGETLYLSCSITDTGLGMSPEEIKRVFSRFEQANSRTSIKYGGSGLGLFISQKLAEKHGGGIGVSSSPGTGSTFVFYAMARRAAAEDNVPATRPLVVRSKSSRESGDPSKGLHSSKIHVLLVEDNLVNQQLLRKQLEKAGCVVYVANHGMEALDILETTTCWHMRKSNSKHLDIILMDWEMPVMDGLTCSREIRNLERAGKLNRHLQIIAITANARSEQIEAAKGAGMNSVLSKPFLVSDLLRRMKELLRATEQSNKQSGLITGAR